MKDKQDQSLATRKPRQQRAQHKVELILEAAMRLLEKDGFPGLTTNAVAATAGVSIGTLYQYFPNKEAILDELASREVAVMSANVLTAMEDPAPLSAAERIGRVVGAVASSYGARTRVHRLVMEHTLSRGSRRLAPLFQRMTALLASDGRPVPLATVDAFVLTHAVSGVLRAMTTAEDAPDPATLEAALVRLLTGFVATRSLAM